MRKHQTELALVNHCDYMTILEQGDLNLLKNNEIFAPKNKPFYLYLVTRRPRISFKADSLLLEKNLLTGMLEVHNEDIRHQYPFVIGIPLTSDKPSIHAEFPFKQIDIIYKEGKLTLNADFVMDKQMGLPRELLDLEVVYIGQAFGTTRARNSQDRLINHETLQAIYFDTLSKFPNQDVKLVLCSFDTQYIIHSGPESALLDDNINIENIAKVLTKEFNLEETINLIEAALIRYFSPNYNKHFKSTFPSIDHKSYNFIFNEDFASVVVEITTTNITRGRLWSPTQNRAEMHYATFDLRSLEVLSNMFEVFGIDMRPKSH